MIIQFVEAGLRKEIDTGSLIDLSLARFLRPLFNLLLLLLQPLRLLLVFFCIRRIYWSWGVLRIPYTFRAPIICASMNNSAKFVACWFFKTSLVSGLKVRWLLITIASLIDRLFDCGAQWGNMVYLSRTLTLWRGCFFLWPGIQASNAGKLRENLLTFRPHSCLWYKTPQEQVDRSWGHRLLCSVR